VDVARQDFQNAQALYEAVCDELGKANVVQSLYDLELRLDNIDLARQHLNLYEAECSQFGEATVQLSLGDSKFRLANVDVPIAF
jgi:hypothetical protein